MQVVYNDLLNLIEGLYYAQQTSEHSLIHSHWEIYNNCNCFMDDLVSPQIYGLPIVRAVARVSIVVIPAVFFYITDKQEKSIYDYFLFRENWQKGILLGGGIAVLYFGLVWLFNSETIQISFHFPVSFSIWLNFILGSPFAEEMFFRGILLQELRTILGSAWAILISAFAFALLHLPQWLILDNLFGVELLSMFSTMFIYGIIFAILVNLTRSLWSSLIPHWINNFILFAIN